MHFWEAHLKSEDGFDSLFFALLLETVLKAKNIHLYTQTRWRSELPEGPYYRHLKESASHHVFAFAQLRAEDTEIDPHGLEEKAQNAENHQLRQLCETALVHYAFKGTCQSDCIPGELI